MFWSLPRALEIPVRAYGGEACLGGVIERCGHWAAEERPDVVASIVRDLASR